MNIHCWIDYSYYDGMWCFSQLLVQCKDERITSWRVSWLNSEASNTDSEPS